jgi:uncharacterized damage-inducible protein DinB
MVISPDVLLSHIDYTRWASARLVDAASKLTHEDLTRDMGTADKSILGTLVHIFAADRIWMGRITGNVPAKFVDYDRDMHLSVLQNDWPALLDQWREWIAGLTSETVQRPISYKNLKGDARETPVWQIILHVVNHGAHHRGQVSGFLRAMGHVPPQIDLIVYYWEQAAAKR